jgi:hypothetical protein
VDHSTPLCGGAWRPERERVCVGRYHPCLDTRSSSVDQFETLNDSDAIALENEAGQTAGRVCAGIDVNAVRPDVGHFRWRVTMDDDLAKVLLVQQEVVADPEQIMFALPRKWNPRSHAGMRKKEIAARKG